MCSKNKKVKESVRKTAVAGSFYPSNRAELSSTIKALLESAPTFQKKDINAIIVPHAGYLFSGSVSATAYKTLNKEYKNIFLIGSSHHLNFDGISIYDRGDYQTPLGRVKVNKSIVKKLQENSIITYKKEAHTKEHTLEVQLPFLQTIYSNKLQIVPIIVASSSVETLKSLAATLKPYFNDDNLFVISTDLSHYPSYEDAKRVDTDILNAIQSNNSFKFIESIQKAKKAQIPNLQTSACGWSSLLTLLYITENSSYEYETLEYKNSGDSKYGDHSRVVGYGAMRVTQTQEAFFLTSPEKKELKELAKATLYEAVLHNRRLEIDSKKILPKLKKRVGAFVTLHLNNKLKGCIGRFEPQQSLYNVVIDMSIAASRHDTRFTPLKAQELEDTDIEISVLTPRKKITSIEEIEIGKHGISVHYGKKSGTYLPHVATQMNWSRKEFVESCCREKALMSPQECELAEIYTYEAIVF